MSIEDAIRLLREKCADNKGRRWIRNPVAYTLYEVWKIADSKGMEMPTVPTIIPAEGAHDDYDY